jgi:hypothetical protein
MKYQGIVTDRLNENRAVYKSRPTTWENAHARAERKARSLGCGDRFSIVTEVKDEKGKSRGNH